MSIAGRAKPPLFLPFIQLKGICTRLACPDEGFSTGEGMFHAIKS